MSFITNFILSKGQKDLRKFEYEKTSASSVVDVFSRYEEYLPLMEQCYRVELYWHGTGRYHYEYTMGSRVGEVDTHNYFDVLGSIIKNDGLIPHQDLFVSLDEQKKTISLTPYRMYARCYAEIHQYEKAALLYEYGDIAFWMKIIILLQVIALLKNNPFKNYVPRLFKIIKGGNISRNVNGWVGALRSDANKRQLSIRHLDMVRSDIPENYGILLAFKKSSVETVSFDEGVERFEVRTNNKITLSDLSHVEVPLVNVQVTRELLEESSLKISVIPIEFAERYCNKYSLRELL